MKRWEHYEINMSLKHFTLIFLYFLFEMNSVYHFERSAILASHWTLGYFVKAISFEQKSKT